MLSSPRIQLLAIGNELVFGSTQDTNSSFIARALAGIGLSMQRICLVKDESNAISTELKNAVELSEVVITTGGLGPTSDDVTRNAIAEVAGLVLTENEAAKKKLADVFARRGRPLNPNNLRQIEFPAGAEVIENRLGTADAFITTVTNTQGKKVAIISLPGIPKETIALIEEKILPWFRARYSELEAPVATYLRCFGLSESYIGMKIEAEKLSEKIEVSYRPMFPEILLTLYHRGRAPREKRQSELKKISALVENAIGKEFIFSHEADQTLADTVAGLFLENRLTLAAAESCSGGLLSHQLVNIAGASKFFRSSVVSYSNDAKAVFLGVRPAIIERYGAVSELVAMEMARGARYRVGADYGISITGIAGPDGGSEEKPVGTFWIGLSVGDRDDAFRHHFPADRNAFRQYCVGLSLDLLRRKILGLPLSWERR